MPFRNRQVSKACQLIILGLGCYSQQTSDVLHLHIDERSINSLMFALCYLFKLIYITCTITFWQLNTAHDALALAGGAFICSLLIYLMTFIDLCRLATCTQKWKAKQCHTDPCMFKSFTLYNRCLPDTPAKYCTDEYLDSSGR